MTTTTKEGRRCHNDDKRCRAAAPLRAAWAAVTEDRRKARIVAIEVVGVSERLERQRRETRQALAQLTADNAMSLAAARASRSGSTQCSPRAS